MHHPLLLSRAEKREPRVRIYIYTHTMHTVIYPDNSEIEYSCLRWNPMNIYNFFFLSPTYLSLDSKNILNVTFHMCVLYTYPGRTLDRIVLPK